MSLIYDYSELLTLADGNTELRKGIVVAQATCKKIEVGKNKK